MNKKILDKKYIVYRRKKKYVAKINLKIKNIDDDKNAEHYYGLFSK